MRILILQGSPRKGGNTEMLASAFAEGASQHHEVEILHVTDYRVNPCIGCNTCFTREDRSCFQQDDMRIVYDKMAKADMLVIASPVYFYGLSAQLKAVVDRFHNPIRDTFHIRKMALLLVGGATVTGLFDSIQMQYQLCLGFFGIEDAGRILASGVRDKGAIRDTEYLRQAFELGNRI